MRPADDGLIQRALELLPIAERLAVAAAIERPWQVARRRQAMRNAALCEAVSLLPEGPLTRRAKDLARHLRRYAEAGWKRGQMPDDPLGAALHQVLALDGGTPLAWRRIYALLAAEGGLQNSLIEIATATPEAADHARAPASDPAPRTAAPRVRDAALRG